LLVIKVHYNIPTSYNIFMPSSAFKHLRSIWKITFYFYLLAFLTCPAQRFLNLLSTFLTTWLALLLLWRDKRTFFPLKFFMMCAKIPFSLREIDLEYFCVFQLIIKSRGKIKKMNHVLDIAVLCQDVCY